MYQEAICNRVCSDKKLWLDGPTGLPTRILHCDRQRLKEVNNIYLLDLGSQLFTYITIDFRLILVYVPFNDPSLRSDRN